MLLVADNARSADFDVGSAECTKALGGLLKQAAIALQHKKLLWVLGS